MKEKINQTKLPWIILISGIPNSGKSTLAVKLAASLNWSSCISTDDIKTLMRKYDLNPYLHGNSHDCWKLLGKYYKKRFLAGYMKHCEAIETGIKSVIMKAKVNGENLIIEGVHILPELFRNIEGFNKYYFIIVQTEENKIEENIRKKIIDRHHIQKNVWSKKKKNLISVQNEIYLNADKYRNTYILKNYSQDENVLAIKKILGDENVQ